MEKFTKKLQQIVEDLNYSANEKWQDEKHIHLGNIKENGDIVNFSIGVGKYDTTFFTVEARPNGKWKITDSSNAADSIAENVLDDFMNYFYPFNKIGRSQQEYNIEVSTRYIFYSEGSIVASVTDGYGKEVLSISVIEPDRVVELCNNGTLLNISYNILKQDFPGLSPEVAAIETATLMALIENEIYTKFAPAKIRVIKLIKHELKAKNISQKELAIKLSASETQVSNWLAGRVEISIKNFYKICEILEIKFKS